MTDFSHLIWFTLAAAVIATLLTVGMLAAADLLPRRRDREEDLS
jgi:hypothetical protein